MFFLLYGETNSTKAKGGNRDVIEGRNWGTEKVRELSKRVNEVEKVQGQLEELQKETEFPKNTKVTYGKYASRVPNEVRMESTSGLVPSKTLSSI